MAVHAGVLLVLTLTLGACGEERPEEGSDAPEEAAEALAASVDEAPEEPSPVRPRVRPRPAPRARRSSAFAHDPHQEIACERCHTRVEGHATHSDPVVCSDCHGSAALAEAVPTAAECMSCHHGAEHQLTCGDCHEPGERTSGPVQVALRMSVLEQPLVRTLEFQHDVHEERACGDCHVEAVTRRATETCEGCHAEHHEASRDCAACHDGARALEEHDLGVHRGCGGTGCHQDPAIAALGMSRPLCLSCHVEQVEHEAPDECLDCHTPGPGEAIGRPRGDR